jgi:hypothetical protein
MGRPPVRTVTPPGVETPPNVLAGAFSIDALDFFGTWKLFDGLTDAVFYGQNRRYALGSMPEQTFMGLWSDGVAVTPLEVIVEP